MALRNAFADLVTEPIARRLNYIVTLLQPLGLVVDKSNSTLRLGNMGTVTSVTGVTTVSTVTTVNTLTTCSTVTTCGTVNNLASIGGASAISLVGDAMGTRWASTVRRQIT